MEVMKCSRCITLLKRSHINPSMSFAVMQKRYYAPRKARCHYDTLGVKEDATQDEVKQAFLRLSKELHPDKNPHDPGTHNKFVELNHAYTVLGKETSRKEYDIQRRFTNNEPQWNRAKHRYATAADYYDPYMAGNGESMKPVRNFSKRTIVLAMFGIMALGSLNALITIKWHYGSRKKKLNDYWRKNEAAYRHDRAMQLVNNSDDFMESIRRRIKKRKELEIKNV